MSKQKFLVKYGDANHLHKLFDSYDNKHLKVNALEENPSVNRSHITQAIGDSNVNVYRTAIDHPLFDSDHLHHMIDAGYSNSAINHAIAYSDKVNKDHLTKVLNNKDVSPYVKIAALEHKHADSSHIDIALKDPSAAVRHVAISSDVTTKEQLERHVNDPDDDVAWTAKDKLERKHHG